MKYRPDIDGLRAIAVLSVVIFHAFPDALRGGFTGVDIFFVISGYLISKVILEKLDSGEFSFLDFYNRRIKRIFPALSATLAFAAIFGWLTLLDHEYKLLGKHILAGASFVSNFALWSESGYFDKAAETKPLLHLWSLGIEEQFYLIYPILLWAFCKNRKTRFYLIGALALASFAVNLYYVRAYPAATFYSPLTRFWELLAGCLLSLSRPEKNDRNHQSPYSSYPNFFSAVGFGLILFGFLRVHAGMSFPGKWALLPVLGSILVIHSGERAAINRILLSNRLMVGVGLISYPLYLWHWVFLSFPRIIGGQEPGIIVRTAAVGAALLFATLTYFFIERPIRFSLKHKATGPLLFAAVFLLGLGGLTIFKYDGFPSRADAKLYAVLGDDKEQESLLEYSWKKYHLCTPQEIAEKAEKTDFYTRCMQSKPSSKIDVALVGDSHAEHLFLGMAEALQNKNVVYYEKSNPPFLGISDYDDIFRYIRNNTQIKVVVLTMAWIPRLSQVPSGSTLEAELLKVIDHISRPGRSIILTDDLPYFPFAPDKCKGFRRFAADKRKCSEPAASFEADSRLGSVRKSFREVASKRPEVIMVSTRKLFCDSEKCSMNRDNTVLFSDDNHLNISGSRFVGSQIVNENPEVFSF